MKQPNQNLNQGLFGKTNNLKNVDSVNSANKVINDPIKNQDQQNNSNLIQQNRQVQFSVQNNLNGSKQEDQVNIQQKNQQLDAQQDEKIDNPKKKISLGNIDNQANLPCLNQNPIQNLSEKLKSESNYYFIDQNNQNSNSKQLSDQKANSNQGFQKIIFQTINIPQKDLILKHCLLSNKNFYQQIQQSDEIAFLLLNYPQIIEKVLKMTQSLDFKEDELEQLNTCSISFKSNEIKALVRQQCELQNIAIRVAIQVLKGQSSDQLQEIRQNLPQLLQVQCQKERILSLKITYHYVCLQQQSKSGDLLKLFNEYSLIKNLNDLIIRDLEEQKWQLKIILRYIRQNGGQWDPNLLEKDLPYDREKKQQVMDVAHLLALQWMNVEITAEHIFQQEGYNTEKIQIYYSQNGQKINQSIAQQKLLSQVQTVWNLIINYYKEHQIESFKNLSSLDSKIKNEYLERILHLMSRSIFQEEKELYSLIIKDTLTICIQCQNHQMVDENLEKYVKIFSQISQYNNEIKAQFWCNEIHQQKGFGVLFSFIQNSYPRYSLQLCKIIKSATSTQYTGQVIQLFRNLELFQGDFQQQNNIWNDLFKEWVVFLKQLINIQLEQLINIRLPVIKFIKLVCQLIIDSPLHFTDIEFYLINQSRDLTHGYVLAFILMDSFYYFQRLKNPPFKLLSLIIDALKSAFKIRKLKIVICKVIQVYGHTIQSQMSHHPFFEVINLIKSEQSLTDLNDNQNKIFGSLSSFLLEIFINCDDLNSFFPLSQNVLNCQLHSVLMSLHGPSEPMYWTQPQTVALSNLFLESQIYPSSFIQDYFGFMFNYLMPLANSSRFSPLLQRKIQSDIVAVLTFELSNYRQTIERVALSNQVYPGVGFEFINSTLIADMLLEILEIQLPGNENDQFDNKIFSHYQNLVELDSSNKNEKLQNAIQRLIQNALACLAEIVNLIDIFIENQTQQTNLKYIGQLQLVSQFGQILCFKEKMFFYQEFYRNKNSVQQVKINLILAIASHFYIIKEKQSYQIENQLYKKLIQQPKSKCLIDNETISINALKLLTKIVMLWLHLPQQKQPKLFELFQEISENKGHLNILNNIQIQLIKNLEDFKQDPYTAITTLEFFIVCIESQQQFLNIFINQQQRANEFTTLINDRLLKFVFQAVEFFSQPQQDIFVIFHAKLLLFVTQATKNQFCFAKKFMTSDLMPILISSGFENLVPKISYFQLQHDNPIANHQQIDEIIIQNIQFQQIISLEIQKRLALSHLSDFLTLNILNQNSLISSAIQDFLQKNFIRFIEYFITYGHNNVFLNQKQIFLQQIYNLILQVAPNFKLQMDYKLQRHTKTLSNSLFKILDANNQGFDRDYLIDSKELFSLLKQFNLDEDMITQKILFTQNQNLMTCLIELDAIAFSSFIKPMLLLLSLQPIDSQAALFSSLQTQNNDIQILFKQNLQVINPNYKIIVPQYLNLSNLAPQGIVQQLLQLLFQFMIMEGDEHSNQINQYAFDLITYSLIWINAEPQNDLQWGGVVNNGFSFFHKALNHIGDKEMLAFNYFLNYLKDRKVIFSNYPEFQQILEILNQFLQRDQQTNGTLNAIKTIILIDGYSFIEKANHSLIQTMADKLQIGDVQEQIMIVQILNLIVNCSRENKGIDLLKNLNTTFCLITSNNLSLIDKEEYYSETLRVNKQFQIQLFIEMMRYLRDYLIQMNVIKDPSSINVHHQFFKQYFGRVQKVLRLPLKTLEKQDIITMEYLQELNALLSFLFVVYSDKMFFQSCEMIFEQLFFDMSNFTIFLFQQQGLQIQAKSNHEKILESTFGLSGNSNVFLQEIDWLQLQILSSYSSVLSLCYQSSQFLYLFAENHAVTYDLNFWEEVLEGILSAMIWVKKLGAKWIQQERPIKELIKKQQYLLKSGVEWQTNVQLQISVIRRLVNLACIHLEMHSEFRRLYNYPGNAQNTQYSIDKICLNIDDIEKLYYKYNLQDQSNKYLKFEKNDESSWSIFQIYKHFLKQELEI